MGEPVAIVDLVSDLYKKLDGVTEQAIKPFGVTCTKGCSSCCKILALCGFSEALLIANHILSKPDWAALIPALRKQALACLPETTKTYAKKMIPCAFLGSDGLCGIYDVRPAACRFYYVNSNPAHCSALSPTTHVQVIDLSLLEMEVWKLNAGVSQELNLPPVGAPIPLFVLHVIKMIAKECSEAEQKLIDAALEGLPDPASWCLDFIDRDDPEFADERSRTLAGRKMRGEL